MICIFRLVVLLSIYPLAAAQADWGYTKWGMTPAQVVSASGGSVSLLPPGKQTRDEADGWVLSAQGSYTDGALKLPVGFTFDTKSGGLKCVMLNAFGDDVASLRQIMITRYGKPAEESSFGPTTMLTWKTPDKIELVIGDAPRAAVVTHCRP